MTAAKAAGAALLALMLPLASPAAAVTIPFRFDAAAMTVSGPAGSGASVMGAENTGFELRSGAGKPWGRYDTDGDGQWLDSRDWSRAETTLDFSGWQTDGYRVAGFSFDVTDAFDMPDQPAFGGASYFRVAINGTSYELGPQRNASLNRISYLFQPGEAPIATLAFETRWNDGFGIDGGRVDLSPVPLPAAAWLMLAGGGVLGAMRLRRRKPVPRNPDQE